MLFTDQETITLTTGSAVQFSESADTPQANMWGEIWNSPSANRPAPSITFANDPDTGIFRVSPRKPGEVRRGSSECHTPEGWITLDHVEDDSGMRWIYKGKPYPSDGSGGSYIYGGLPWEKGKSREQNICFYLKRKYGLDKFD